MRVFFAAFVRGKIDYGDIVYYAATHTSKRKIDVIQNSALKIITGTGKGTCIEAIEVASGTTPLNLRRKQLILYY